MDAFEINTITMLRPQNILNVLLALESVPIKCILPPLLWMSAVQLLKIISFDDIVVSKVSAPLNSGLSKQHGALCLRIFGTSKLRASFFCSGGYQSEGCGFPLVVGCRGCS